jgi:acyl-CoA hydrolase
MSCGSHPARPAREAPGPKVPSPTGERPVRHVGRHDGRVRLTTIEAVRRRLAGLPSGPEPLRVVSGGNGAVPWTLLGAIDAELAAYRLFMLNAPAGVPDRAGVELETPFVGIGMRRSDRLSYLPARLSQVPQLLHTATPPDVVLVNVSPPRRGVLSLGTEVNILPAAIEAARARGGLVIAQVNAAMPYTFGDAALHPDDVDLAVEADEPLGVLAEPASDDQARAVADRVVALVPPAATLQTGIGAIPNGVLNALVDRRDLRVWTEMFSDGMVALAHGTLDVDVPIVTSFVWGSPDLYAWVDGNRRVVMTRTERTNDPAWIARQPAMTSINAALQVDLFGQANASYVRGLIYSGFGGQSDFVVGALHAPGGQAIIALRSWHALTATSTVVPQLSCPVTSFQQSAVVTDQGAARLWGVSQQEQARRLVEQTAHPDAREGLRAAAAGYGLSWSE